MSQIEGINMFGWHTNIFCTLEEPQVTSLGVWPGNDVLGVALPCVGALRKRVWVKYNNIICYAEVLDVGPWATDNDGYVFGSERPRAEIYKGSYCPMTKNGKARATVPDGNGGWIAVEVSNGSGIDIFPGTAKYLGIKDNTYVEWKFED